MTAGNIIPYHGKTENSIPQINIKHLIKRGISPKIIKHITEIPKIGKRQLKRFIGEPE